MSELHEYLVITKLPTLSSAEFVELLEALRDEGLGTRPSGLPHERLHWALSVDKTLALCDGMIETDNLNGLRIAKIIRRRVKSVSETALETHFDDVRNANRLAAGKGKRAGAAAGREFRRDKPEWGGVFDLVE